MIFNLAGGGCRAVEVTMAAQERRGDDEVEVLEIVTPLAR